LSTTFSNDDGAVFIWPTLWVFLSLQFLNSLLYSRSRTVTITKHWKPAHSSRRHDDHDSIQRQIISTCNSILHEARTMFGLDFRYTPDSTSPSVGSCSSEGVHEGTSKYSDSTPSPHEKSINDNVLLPYKRPKDTYLLTDLL
jgi:hypothetical protein